MKPDETFAVRMSSAEWYSFANQHRDAAKFLFEKAAQRQKEHLNKPGLDHKLKLLVNEGGYRDKVRDAKAVHEMATNYDWSAPPQKPLPPVVNVPYDPNAPTYESSIAGAMKQRALDRNQQREAKAHITEPQQRSPEKDNRQWWPNLKPHQSETTLRNKYQEDILLSLPRDGSPTHITDLGKHAFGESISKHNINLEALEKRNLILRSAKSDHDYQIGNVGVQLTEGGIATISEYIRTGNMEKVHTAMRAPRAKSVEKGMGL